jgi:hypothetical protein
MGTPKLLDYDIISLANFETKYVDMIIQLHDSFKTKKIIHMIHSQQLIISSGGIYILPVCPNLLGTKRLGCYCCCWTYILLMSFFYHIFVSLSSFLCFNFLLYFHPFLFGYFYYPSFLHFFSPLFYLYFFTPMSFISSLPQIKRLDCCCCSDICKLIITITIEVLVCSPTVLPDMYIFMLLLILLFEDFCCCSYYSAIN